jgi:hypothetical protein
MRAMSKATQKQLLINHYNDLREQAVEEISTEVMQQTCAILLYSMMINEKSPLKDPEALKLVFEQFVDTLNMPGTPFGKTIETCSMIQFMEEKLGVDFDKIQSHFKLEITK